MKIQVVMVAAPVMATPVLVVSAPVVSAPVKAQGGRFSDPYQVRLESTALRHIARCKFLQTCAKRSKSSSDSPELQSVARSSV